MNDLLFSLNAVLPVFLVMGAGYLLARLHVFTAPFVEKGNSLCFQVFLPVLLFYNIASSDFTASFDAKTVLYGVGGTLLLCGVLSAAVPLFVKDNARRGVMVQGMFRSNFLLLGVPLCTRLAGEDGMLAASVMSAFLIPTYNLLATVVLARYAFKEKPRAGEVAKKVLLNPLIIASALGLAFSLLRVPIPQAVNAALADVSGIATPFALMMLGAGFEFKAVTRNIAAIATVLSVKLIAAPALLLAVAAMLGFKGTGYAVLLCAFGTPIAVSSYVMALRENGDGELACHLVVLTSVFSSLTMFGLVYVSRLLGLL